jgi:copper chaperone
MTTTLSVQNLKCGGCAHTITQQLRAMEALQNVIVDLQQGTVSVTYQNESDLKNITQKLKKMGYPVLGEANTLSDQAHSLVRCVMGKLAR